MRVLKTLAQTTVLGCAVSMIPAAAFAGAYDTQDIGSMELLFAPERFVAEFGATYVDRNVKYKAKNSKAQGGAPLGVPLPTLGGATIPKNNSDSHATPNIWYWNAAVKFDVFDNLSCLAKTDNPYSINEDLDEDWQGRHSITSTLARSFEIDGLCAYKFQLNEDSSIRAIGGLRAVDLSYRTKSQVLGGALLTANPALAGLGVTATEDYLSDVDLESDGFGFGWRAGAAYELPKYAIRASLIYSSEVDIDLDGTRSIADLAPLTSGAKASVTLPQSVEFNFQTGIAPGWLARFGVKWMDWSTFDALEVGFEDGSNIVRQLDYVDGWTIMGGVGHQLTEKLSVGTSLTWDRGVGGSYSDLWVGRLGGAYDISDKVKFTLGGAAAYKQAASNRHTNGSSGAETTFGYDSSWNFAVSSKIRVAF